MCQRPEARKAAIQAGCGPTTTFCGYRRERATATQSRGLKHGLSKVKAHRTKQAIAAMGAEEAHHTAGNSTVDVLAKEACGWHQTAVGTCNAMAKATKWRKEVIIAIGNTLSTLPNTRELYRHTEITEE